MTQQTLTELFRQSKLEEASARLQQGERLPGNIASFDRRQIYTVLAQARAFGLVQALVDQGFIETDLYEYESLDDSPFPALFRKLEDNPDDLTFLQTLLGQLDNINDAVQDKTLMELALLSAAPVAVIRTLIDAGCMVRYKDNYEINYLHKVVREFGIKEELGSAYLELLIGEGIDPNESDIVGETPLHLAISKMKKGYIDVLLAQGADPNQQDKKGESAYYQALVHQVAGTELYEKMKAYAMPDFDSRNKEEETLLSGAVRMRYGASERDIALVKALIEDGADVYQVSPYYSRDKSAVAWIAEKPSEWLQALLDMGVVDIERKDDRGNTLLHQVCAIDVNYDQEAAKQVYRKVKLLLAHGADAQATNDAEQTPALLAGQDNLKAKTVELLLKK
ncbi:ankyrin repeat domain-containing protein [Taibaiella koreensis]|uniref:ankyrin repeat domain-containing protein n=1 Tax=Taibaiella koreensis TaxID=1268548 RepID=UPI000E59F488|nr:hypothetical protein [Taibaiella koreensis]